MSLFLVEITQEQCFTVEVEADSEQSAIEKVHKQLGRVVADFPPELKGRKSRVIRAGDR